MKTVSSIIAIIFLLPLSYVAQHTVTSTCNLNDTAVTNKYKVDAERMAVRFVRNNAVLYTDSIQIDRALRNRYYRSLIAVYNATIIPSRDTVVNIYNIHTDRNPELRRINITASPTLNWMQQLKVNDEPTSNTIVNNLLKQHTMQYTYFQAVEYDMIALTSDSSVNLIPVAQKFLALPGVLTASIQTSFYDVVNITDSVNTNFIGLSYSFGWGSCEDTCNYRRHWNFKVYNDCSVEYLGITGSPLFLNLKKYNYLQVISVFPNPTSDKIVIKNPNISNSEIQVVIYNALGMEVYASNNSDSEHVVNLENLPKGIYLVHLTAEGLARTVRIVKQ